MTAEAWQPDPVRPVGCDHDHSTRGGSLDESARRLSHSELAAAELLRGEGHRVRSLPEQPGRGRVADLEVCGQPVEVKSWMPQAERQGPPRTQSVYNKLASARSQAPTVVLLGSNSGLTAAVARAGVAEFVARGQWGRLQTVRVVGEGFDLSWARVRSVDRGRGPDHPGGIAAGRMDSPPDRPGGVAARAQPGSPKRGTTVAAPSPTPTPRARPPSLGW